MAAKLENHGRMGLDCGPVVCDWRFFGVCARVVVFCASRGGAAEEEGAVRGSGGRGQLEFRDSIGQKRGPKRNLSFVCNYIRGLRVSLRTLFILPGRKRVPRSPVEKREFKQAISYIVQ